MRFAYLGSGSRGNAAVINAGESYVLLDCGLPLVEVDVRLQRLGLKAEALSAIVVTHEHGDHIGGVARLARRNQIPVWLTAGTLAAWKAAPSEWARTISPHRPFELGALRVEPYPVPHDAREPCQYVFGDGRYRVGVLTDAGSVTPHMREVLSGLDALLLEFNHDQQMLLNGPYPRTLKTRVAGPKGHLSNAQAAELLAAIDCTRLQHLVLTHLSETNNTPEQALAAASAALGHAPDWLVCAHQDDGLDWRELN
ncbi:MAG: MBL fold metallo-hydrolase [Nevskia sp.]|jgi:phosphoribosyl 1,2-cyclic phosphodiesterase|nr:MBL fold metallo-hydrolase [Nevskia sp.]MCK9385782.1 MBL fold metallo-hydrolase [Nevskia sp.]